jgi:uncharacterized protein with HEPN domain
MLDRAILHLTRIVEAIDTIKGDVAGLDKAAFLADRLRRDAVAMNFQMLGEAARRLTAAERAEAPEIPWPQIVNLRHRISHDYRTVNFDLVFDIIGNELDLVRAAVSRMLAARGE